MIRLKTAVLIFCCIAANTAFAQISPPGLGQAHTASWLALGIRQNLDSLKRWESVSYIGIGRKSDVTAYNPLLKASILVLNQEFYYNFHKHWKSSFAVSYRRQNEYADQYPYDLENPAFEQEFRLYSRFSYVLQGSRLEFIPTFRQEFRKFYTPTFTQENENFQLRSRLRLQLKVNLNAAKVHRLIFSSEQLFSTSRLSSPTRWTSLAYAESRLVGYYSLAPKSLPLVFDFGYMLNRLGTSSPTYVHYVALDVIWEDPFGKRKHRRADDNLE